MAAFFFVVFLSWSFRVNADSEMSYEDRRNLARFLANNVAPRPVIRSKQQSFDLVSDINDRVFEVVKEICLQEKIEGKRCTWSISVQRKPDFVAYAHRYNEIVIHTGLIDKTTSDDEVAFVVAHEIAHHILDHVGKQRDAVFVGAILGAITGAGGAAVDLAAMINFWWSVPREVSADRMAAIIIHRAGYSLPKARNIILRIAKMNGRSYSNRFVDSHPAALERIHAFDNIASKLEG